MRKAGIKVWVLTGDKVDTAKNIGFSCNLLDQEMTLLEFSTENTNVMLNESIKMIAAQKNTSHNEKTGLIVTGPMLINIMAKRDYKDESAEELFKNFSEIALASNVVLCCRVSPKQKADIVALVKFNKKSAITLSIGDGANDVNMITEAHLGVGIRGHEGQQAARASDFAVGEFQMLKELLFYHGRESYRKNSTLVLYNFYKNVLICMPQFWWGFTNYFSGQTLYEALHYQAYNVLYTSFPIMIYALWDSQTNRRVLTKNHELYAAGPKRILFNARRFLIWFAVGCLQSALISLIALNLIDDAWENTDGGTYGFWTFGMTVFFAVSLMVNLKLLTFSSSFFFWNILFVTLSVLALPLTWFGVSVTGIGYVLSDTFLVTMKSLNFWLVIFFTCGMAICDYSVSKFADETAYKRYLPTYDHISKEFELSQNIAEKYNDFITPESNSQPDGALIELPEKNNNEEYKLTENDKADKVKYNKIEVDTSQEETPGQTFKKKNKM